MLSKGNLSIYENQLQKSCQLKNTHACEIFSIKPSLKHDFPQLNFLKKYGILGFNNCIYTIMAIFFLR